MARAKIHYVNNQDFLKAMIEYKRRVKEADERGKERPQITNYIADCFLRIARGLASKPNFSGYQYKEDMINDAVENCLKYINNFDPEKSENPNPFAYFTQISYFAFLRRIEYEKKNLYTKYKLTERSDIFDTNSDHQEHDDSQYNDSIKTNEWSREYMGDFIESFENRKKKRANRQRMDSFIKENEHDYGNDGSLWEPATEQGDET